MSNNSTDLQEKLLLLIAKVEAIETFCCAIFSANAQCQLPILRCFEEKKDEYAAGILYDPDLPETPVAALLESHHHMLTVLSALRYSP